MAHQEPLRRPARPRTVRHLNQLVGRYAHHHQLPQDRVRRWISYMIVGGALDRGRDERDSPLLVLKGGVAIELRLQMRARATKDLDAVFRRSIEDLGEAVDKAFAQPYGGFTLRRHGKPEAIADKAVRIKIRLVYERRTWATVPLEVSPAPDGEVETETLPALDLEEFGLEGPAGLHCLSLRYQIAQKIHAVTRPTTPDVPNDRFRDLADLYLLKELVEDLPDLRAACEYVFEVRNAHKWPPAVFLLPEWEGPLRRLAVDLGIALEAEDLRTEIEAFVGTVATA